MRHSTLTGSWSGAYRYPVGGWPETVFNVQIEEIAGAFTGSIQEPNLTRAGFGPIATSDIDGVRSGQAVSFTKFYDGSGGMHHAVLYEGAANEALTRVEGRWTIPRDGSGTFFMTRDDDGAAEAKKRAEELVGHPNK